MAHASSTGERVYSLRISDGLYFNFIPLNSSNQDSWRGVCDKLRSSFHKGNGGGDLYLARIVGRSITMEPNVTKYIVAVTDRKFEITDNPDTHNIEMLMAVSVALEAHLSQHIGIQRYEVANPHNRISANLHAFGAFIVKEIFPEVMAVISHPLSNMREILMRAFDSKQIQKAVTIIWDNSKDFRSDAMIGTDQHRSDQCLRELIEEQQSTGFSAWPEEGVLMCRNGTKISCGPKPSIMKATYPGNDVDDYCPQIVMCIGDVTKLWSMDVPLSGVME